MVASAPPARFAALHHRNFALLWVGLLVSNVGTWMQNVGQSWLVLQLTNSPLWLGLLGLSFAIPMIVLPLMGGAVADRVRRIRLLYVTQAGQMLLALALGALTVSGAVRVWQILLASFLGAVLLAFDNPARQALVYDLVPQEDLLNALSLNAATYTGAALVGPALAGVLLVPLGPAALFFINGVSFLAVLLALAAMRGVRSRGSGGPATLGQAMRAGLTYAWRTRYVLGLLGLSAMAAIFGRSYQLLLPIFARDIWSAGPAGYGLLLSAAGAGALVGALGLAAFGRGRRQGALMVLSGLAFSLSLMLFALSPVFLAGFLLLFAAGVLATVFTTLISTQLQLTSPNHLRGRVMSLYAITLIGLPSLGALAIGALAERLGGLQGAPEAVLIGGMVMGATMVVAAPALWRRDTKS
ncbi:MAG TPA: MFS transporter [Anaerolineales bacterium]|nr:MFS transporter [Anaerolineales bacterium]